MQQFSCPPVTSKDVAETGHKGSLLELMKPMGMSWKVASSMQIVGGYLNLRTSMVTRICFVKRFEFFGFLAGSAIFILFNS